MAEQNTMPPFFPGYKAFAKPTEPVDFPCAAAKNLLYYRKIPK
jgi:hypothetical protein